MAAISDADRLLLNEFFKQVANSGAVRFPVPAVPLGDLLQEVSSGTISGTVTVDALISHGIVQSNTVFRQLSGYYGLTADGASAVGHKFDTIFAYANGGSKLASWSNAGTEVMALYANDAVVSGPVLEMASGNGMMLRSGPMVGGNSDSVTISTNNQDDFANIQLSPSVASMSAGTLAGDNSQVYHNGIVMQLATTKADGSRGDIQLYGYLVLWNFTDATRGSPGSPGRVIFNLDDGNLNIDNGAHWILPNGTIT